MLTFGEDGTLYVGSDINEGGERIYRVGPGGSVTYYGPPMYDPDAVLFDPAGTFSGTPGSVLLGGHGGYIAAIKPDESAVDVFRCPSRFENPSDMEFDSNGRLVFVDYSEEAIFRSMGPGDVPQLLAPVPGPSHNLAIDSDDIIFVALPESGQIKMYDSDGTPLGDFASGLRSNWPAALPIALSPGGGWGNGLYTISDGQLLRLDENGTATTIGAGFDAWYLDMAFGPDGALYISANRAGYILRVTEPDTTPPSVRCTVSRDTLWPPNHKVVEVQVFVMAHDDISSPENLTLEGVFVQSSEPDDGLGDGDTAGDVEGQDGFTAPVDVTDAFEFDEELGVFVGTILLRAERAGNGKGRTYTLEAFVKDEAGNVGGNSGQPCTVRVGHDQGKQKANDK